MPYLLRYLFSMLLAVTVLCSPKAAETPWNYSNLSPENQNFMQEILHNSQTIIDYTNQHLLNPQAPVTQDFLNLSPAHQLGSRQAVSFLNELMGMPYEIIPGFNDQPLFESKGEENHEKPSELFEDISSNSSGDFLNILDEAVSDFTFNDTNPQADLGNLYGLTGEEFINQTKASITEALQQQGANTEEINVVLKSEHISSLISRSAEFAEQRKGLNVTVTLIGEQDSPSLAPNRVLASGLRICTEAAKNFNDFAEEYPTLANFSLTAMQVALGGPAGYVRNMAIHYTGLQEQVDGIIEVGKEWVSRHLQEQMGMNPDHADLLTQGGGFGLTVGLTTVGGVSKDKVLHEARNVSDTAKKLMGRSGKQKRLKELASDQKLGKADRGWLQQEVNSITTQSKRMAVSGELRPQRNIRVPPGKELAHRRGKPAKDGNSYEHADLQSTDLHRLQHKHEGYQ